MRREIQRRATTSAHSDRFSGQGRKSRYLLGILAVFVLALLGAAGVQAQEDYSDCYVLGTDGCPLQKLGCPLVQGPTLFATVIDPETGKTLIDTTIVVEKRSATCVPVVTGSGVPTENDAVEWQTLTLRNYGETFPGTTYRVWKDQLEDPDAEFDATNNPVKIEGTNFKVLLENRLTYGPGETTSPKECRPAQFAACTEDLSQKCTCDSSSTDCTDLANYSCSSTGLSDACTILELAQGSPNCIHGLELTNLHYHGTHVSPQPHQDYVLLSLYPYDQPGWPFDYDPDNLPEDVAIGSYQTDIPTFPWNQAPGTHWYHGHKHGSTASQTINGMAGALLIQGEFDEFLNDYYGVDPGNPDELERFEKIMVVQQIAEDVLFPLGFNADPNYPPYPLINGQVIPTVEMRYGETQRWRLISATTNAQTQSSFAFRADAPGEVDLSTDLFTGFEVKQIAQDGVQFAPENYTSQPFGDPVMDGFMLSPGNRVDLLVRAPDAPADGKARIIYVMKKPISKLSAKARARVRKQGEALNRQLGIQTKDNDYSAPFIRIYVSGIETNPKPLPPVSDWPEMPPYLRDITRSELDNSGAAVTARTMAFSMTNTTSGEGARGEKSAFFIDGRQYANDCAGGSMNLGSAETWTVTNNSGPSHPYHIHINPFQLISQYYYDSSQDSKGWKRKTFSAPFPWMDTIALKSGTVLRLSRTKIRQRFEDFTGGYVIHCHFLGHEDRGMMTNVQTVCTAPSNEIIFGEPQGDGLPDDCAAASTDAGSPLPPCPAFVVSSENHSLHASPIPRR